MAGLLQKVLKALVLRASSLPAAVQLAAGAKGAAKEARHFHDIFQCFLENYFVDEAQLESSSYDLDACARIITYHMI